MFRPSRLPSRVAIVLVAAATATPAWAQRGLLRGTVVDSEEEPLAEVRVTITSAQLPSFHKVLETDRDGEFSVRFLSNQTQFRYQLLFERPGYRSLEAELSPSGTRGMEEVYVLEEAETQTVERHADLASVVTGSVNDAIRAFNEGLTAQRNGDLAAARGRLEEAIAADAELGPAHVALSQVLLDQEEHEAAIASADRALALDTTARAEALNVKYQALRALGEEEKAEAVAAELEKAEDAASTARRVYSEASEAFQADDHEVALAKFREAADLDPSLVEAHHAVATLLLAKGRHEEAAEAAEKALSLGSGNVQTLRILYDAYQALGRFEELTEIAPRLAEVDPEFGGSKLLEQAAQRWNAGQTAAAVSLARQALAVDPSLAKAYYFIGLDHASRGENAEALQALRKFVELAPDDPEAATAREMIDYLE